MILKYSATDPQQIIASTVAAPTTNPLTSICSFRLRTSTTLTPDNIYADIQDTPVGIVCDSPSNSGEIHYVDQISIHNNDTVQQILTVRWTDGTNFSTVWEGALEPSESAQYNVGSGWQKLNANGDPIVIGADTTPTLNNRYVLTGALYETFDRNLCDEVNTSLLSTGRLSLAAIYIPSGTVVSSISFWSGTTAAGTPTNQLFGLFDSSLNLLRSSTNDTTTAWAANSKKTLALTSTFTTTYSGIHYLGLMVTATTVPTIKGNTAKTNGALNAAAPSMGGTSTTGLTTALPATAAAPATVTTSFWGCIS